MLRIHFAVHILAYFDQCDSIDNVLAKNECQVKFNSNFFLAGWYHLKISNELQTDTSRWSDRYGDQNSRTDIFLKINEVSCGALWQSLGFFYFW